MGAHHYEIKQRRGDTAGKLKQNLKDDKSVTIKPTTKCLVPNVNKHMQVETKRLNVTQYIL